MRQLQVLGSNRSKRPGMMRAGQCRRYAPQAYISRESEVKARTEWPYLHKTADLYTGWSYLLNNEVY